MKLKYKVFTVVVFVFSQLAVLGLRAKDNDIYTKIKLSFKEKHSLIKADNTFLDYSTIKTSSFSSQFHSVKEKQSKFHPVRGIIVGTMMASAFTGMHIYYSNTWWADKVKYFKFAQDGYYARNIDKASHVYTSNLITEASAAGYEWVGLTPSKALLWGSITALAYETYIEIYDGFSPNWGFDWGDVGANIVGAVYPHIQRLVPPLQNVNIKWSFKPSWLKSKVQKQDDLLDDYTNMTFWMSINPELFLPKSLTQKKFYPNFLAIALGWSIKNASHVSGSGNAFSEWYLSFDIDIRKLPGKSDFMQKVKKILNFYHIPMPAVRFTPSGIWYGLYF